jgi:hypothetical protein
LLHLGLKVDETQQTINNNGLLSSNKPIQSPFLQRLFPPLNKPPHTFSNLVTILSYPNSFYGDNTNFSPIFSLDASLPLKTTHTSNIETHPNPWNSAILLFEKPTSQGWMILFHQKFDAKISLGLFGLLNFNFTILDQALLTLFHKVDPMAFLWSVCKHRSKLGLHPPPYVVDIGLTET